MYDYTVQKLQSTVEKQLLIIETQKTFIESNMLTDNKIKNYFFDQRSFRKQRNAQFQM